MTIKAESEGPGRGEITRLLEVTREGDPDAEGELLSRVYHELRALAASKTAREAPGQTLQPTALVHGAWLRLVASCQRTRYLRCHRRAQVGLRSRLALPRNPAEPERPELNSFNCLRGIVGE